jgi:NADPH:quinone reductase-like Zn-dependent oxidoreductase
MKAIVQDRYGPADVLERRDIPRPAPADNEVLIGVRAAGVDRGVWHLITGRPTSCDRRSGSGSPRCRCPAWTRSWQ